MKKIKKWNQVGRAVAVLLLTTAILTSCAPKKQSLKNRNHWGRVLHWEVLFLNLSKRIWEIQTAMSASGKHWMMWWIRTVSTI